MLGVNLDMQSNVRVTVYDKNYNIKYQAEQHNKAGVSLIQGVLKFLRGEFNPSNLTNDMIAHNVNAAKLYIPSYVSFGNGGLTVTGSGSSIVITNEVSKTNFYDTTLEREMVNEQYNRLPISKSELGTSSGADNGILSLTTYVPVGYYTHDPTFGVKDGVVYMSEVGLFSNLYYGTKSNTGKLLARVIFKDPIPQTTEDVILVQWNLGAISIDDKYWVQDKGNFSVDWA